jgi:hypothetical protein
VHEYVEPTGLHWAGLVQVPAAQFFMHMRSGPTCLQLDPEGQPHAAVEQGCEQMPSEWLLMKRHTWFGPHSSFRRHGSPTERPVCLFSMQT